MSHELKRIAADILIARTNHKNTPVKTPEDLAKAFQIIYNQVKFADQLAQQPPSTKPAASG